MKRKKILLLSAVGLALLLNGCNSNATDNNQNNQQGGGSTQTTPATEQCYSFTFKEGDPDNTIDIFDKSVADEYIQSASDIISSYEGLYCYAEPNGFRVGNSGGAGYVTFNFKTSITISRLVFKADVYSNDDSVPYSVFTSAGYENTGLTAEGKDVVYTIDINDETPSSYVKLATNVKKKRLVLQDFAIYGIPSDSSVIGDGGNKTDNDKPSTDDNTKEDETKEDNNQGSSGSEIYVPTPVDYNGTYYDSIDSNLKGTDLVGALKNLLVGNCTKESSYNDCKNYAGDSDPYTKGNNKTFRSFYSHKEYKTADFNSGSGWNREHVWPQSLSGGLYTTSGGGSDINHIRPTITAENTERGNRLFAEIDPKNATKTRACEDSDIPNYMDSDNHYYPCPTVRGDCARICLYMVTRYSMNITNVIDTPSNTKQAAYNLLLKWNAEDPVDEYEIMRNDFSYSFNRTRNPFIDHPEYAVAAFSA